MKSSEKTIKKICKEKKTSKEWGWNLVGKKQWRVK